MEQSIVLSMNNVLIILGGFGTIFGIFYRMLCKKFDKIDERFAKIDEKFDKIDDKISENTKAINDLKTGQAVMQTELHNMNQRLINIENHIRPPKIQSFPTHSHDEPKEN